MSRCARATSASHFHRYGLWVSASRASASSSGGSAPEPTDGSSRAPSTSCAYPCGTWLGQRHSNRPSGENRPSQPCRRLRRGPLTATSGSSGRWNRDAGRRTSRTSVRSGRAGSGACQACTRERSPAGDSSEVRSRPVHSIVGSRPMGSKAVRAEPGLRASAPRAERPTSNGPAVAPNVTRSTPPSPPGNAPNPPACSCSSTSTSPSALPSDGSRWAVKADSTRSNARRSSSVSAPRPRAVSVDATSSPWWPRATLERVRVGPPVGDAPARPPERRARRRAAASTGASAARRRPPTPRRRRRRRHAGRNSCHRLGERPQPVVHRQRRGGRTPARIGVRPVGPRPRRRAPRTGRQCSRRRPGGPPARAAGPVHAVAALGVGGQRPAQFGQPDRAGWRRSGRRPAGRGPASDHQPATR